MNIDRFIKILNTNACTSAYENTIYVSDSKNLFAITDIAVANNACFIFYKDSDVGYNTRGLVRNLHSYNWQRFAKIQFVNKDDNSVATNFRLFNNGYNITLTLIY